MRRRGRREIKTWGARRGGEERSVIAWREEESSGTQSEDGDGFWRGECSDGRGWNEGGGEERGTEGKE